MTGLTHNVVFGCSECGLSEDRVSRPEHTLEREVVSDNSWEPGRDSIR